ncbi:hypothetical protein EST38_g6004 [Candolleomyces aberdarensis]|uniref:Uncharacterized protein n=1 Tax=Candolleomyces aberdarensis TaxID=2316362 RepID=A0A4Q2DKX6_9AGAR|nr:hypothetical protein EST38_g6004 [Candolleomyces aberdarensis]
MQTKRLRAQAVRDQVDQRIAKLEIAIRALKTHRNTVANTSPLPPEILSNIFTIVRTVIRVEFWWKPTWAQVAHVCRHWRAVALACPALWSDLMFFSRGPTFTEMMLQRSKNAPLTVKLYGYPSFDDILCKIASQTSRLRDVELRRATSTTPFDLSKILSSFESKAPILEKLVLKGPELYGKTGSDRYHTMPANFLQDGAPSLQHLDITQIAIHWDALPISTTLTHLQLENVVPENRPTRKSFSETLSKLLRLETMKLSAFLPHSGASQPKSLPVILPSLRTLELKDFAAELRQFFSMTRMPQEARVDVELSDVTLESESLESLFSALRASWTLPKDVLADAARNLAQPNILDLRVIDYMPRRKPRIMYWLNNHDLPPNFEFENPPANLIMSAPSVLEIDITLLFKVITGHLNTSSLRSLKISSNQVGLTKNVLELVKDLTKLDKIAIWKSHDALSEFLEILRDHALAFPSLRSIELYDIDFDEELTGYPDTAIRALAAALKSWKKFRPTIDRFAMTECINFVEEHWEVLRAALPKEVEMYWDESEYIVDPSEDEED